MPEEKTILDSVQPVASTKAAAPAMLAPSARARHARVVGPYLQPLLQTAGKSGISPQRLALAAGLAENALDPLPQWISAANYIRLLEVGAQLCNDPYFGLHVGSQVKLGTYNVYGLIILSCQHFGHALQQTLRYEGLAHDLGRSDLQVLGEIAQYQWHCHFPEASRHLADSVFAGIAVFGSWLAGGMLPVREIGLRHSAPEEGTHEYRKILGSVPKFDCEHNYGLFDAALLARPIPNADVSMYPVLQQHAEQLLQEKQRLMQDNGLTGIIAQVRATIIKNLAQDRVRLPMIAEDLHLTQRTLQRKLREANSSFQQVLDETRHELACNYLQQVHLNLAEIAFMLGFQEQSSFNHAFKEWQGCNPGAYRERYLAK